MKLYLHRRSSLDLEPGVGVASFKSVREDPKTRQAYPAVIFRDPDDSHEENYLFDVYIVDGFGWVSLCSFSVTPAGPSGSPTFEKFYLSRTPGSWVNTTSLGMVRWFVEEVGISWPREVAQQDRDLVERVRSARPCPGELCVSPEELEVYKLTGEPPPPLWEGHRFYAWVLEKQWDG